MSEYKRRASDNDEVELIPWQETKGVLQRTIREGVPVNEQTRRKGDDAEQLNQSVKELGQKLLNIANDPKTNTSIHNEISKIRGVEDAEAFAAKNYEIALNTLNTFKLLDTKSKPSIQKVQESLQKQLTTEQREVMKTFQNPVLILKPNYIKGKNLVKALDKNKKGKGKIKIDTYVSGNAEGFLDRADQVSEVKWQIVITEGASSPELLEGDDLSKTLRERIQWFKKKYEAKGIKNIGIKEYILLQLHALTNNNGVPLDNLWGEDGTWTMLEMYENLVSAGSFYGSDGRLYLGDYHVDNKDNYACFRRSVVVPVLP